ncbi:MAG: zinc ribbon domain-containing protein [Betaproteobacteria bacterium]|nr:zinc ribbon domain-containing protein [Betaproteobacteria bacterium]
MICHNCHAELPVSAEACPNCASRVASAPAGEDAPRVCLNCTHVNRPQARFCSSCGVALERQAETSAPASAGPWSAGRKRLATTMTAGALLLALGSGAAYLHFSGFTGDSQETIENRINDELARRGMDAISVSVTPEWEAKVTGSAKDAGQKDAALAMVAQFPDITRVRTDELMVKPRPGALRDYIADGLAEAGIEGLEISVSADYAAVVRGSVASRAQLATAEKILEETPLLTRRSLEVSVPPTPVAPESLPPATTAPDPSKLEGDLNRALRRAGFGNVTAQVNDDLSVDLKGVVTKTDDKQQALKIARSGEGVRGVRDLVFLVEEY